MHSEDVSKQKVGFRLKLAVDLQLQAAMIRNNRVLESGWVERLYL